MRLLYEQWDDVFAATCATSLGHHLRIELKLVRKLPAT